MLQFREKSRYYQALSSVPIEDREEVHGHHAHAKPEALFERLYRRKFQILFLLLTILLFLSYLVLDLKLTGYEYDDELGFIKVENVEDNATNSQTIMKMATTIQQESNMNSTTTATMACQLPKLNPFESSIQHLITEQVGIACTDKFPYLFASTLDSTLITVQNLKEVYPNLRSCCYQALARGSNLSNPDNDYSLSEECFLVPLNALSEMLIPPEHEFIVISCKFLDTNATQANYSVSSQSSPGTDTADDNATFSNVIDMHFFIPEKPLVESRIEEYYEELSENPDPGNQTSANEESDVDTNDTMHTPLPEQDRVNVVILGIDGVSNMNFIRVMPQSYAYLKDNLSAVAMQGFNKIADNTLPNLSASLASMNLSTLQESCVEDTAFDKCPFIWKSFAENGYRTSFAEDSTWMGIFNYEITGMR